MDLGDSLSRLTCFAPVLIVGAVVALQLYMRHRSAPARAAYLHQLRADVIAQRLGLAVVEGDPSFVFEAVGSTGAARRRVVLRGQPAAAGGLPLELVYVYERTDRIGFGEVEVRTVFECRLSAVGRQPFPAFEVFPRGPAIPEKAPLLPEASTQNAGIDARFVVRTEEPRLAGLLGRHIAAAEAGLAPIGLHLFGDGQRVSFLMHEKQPPHPAAALHQAERVAQLVVDLAVAVGG